MTPPPEAVAGTKTRPGGDLEDVPDARTWEQNAPRPQRCDATYDEAGVHHHDIDREAHADRVDARAPREEEPLAITETAQSQEAAPSFRTQLGDRDGPLGPRRVDPRLDRHPRTLARAADGASGLR